MSRIIGYVQGADFFLVLSLIIFMTVFIAATIYMFTLSKETCDKLSQLPLTEKEENENK